MSKMWLEVKEEGRYIFIFFNLFVLATFKKILSKYGNFKRVFPQNVATLAHVFSKKIFVAFTLYFSTLVACTQIFILFFKC
jgi:hypothetical protein